MRECKRCHQAKPEEGYSATGFYFRECYSAYGKAYRSKNQLLGKPKLVSTLVCYVCKNKKAVELFWRDSSSPTGYRPLCMACNLAYSLRLQG